MLFGRNNGFYILKESWDNLIILDACRYDVFEEEFKERSMKGKLEYRISRGAHTTTFLLENFNNGKFDDIVYITANPFVDKLLKGKFYKIISVWKYGWDPKYQTVLPKTMYEYTLYALERYPNKRLIIHFIQPHYPYIGFPFTDGSFERLRNSALNNTSFKVSRKYKDTMFSIYAMDIYAMIDKDILLKAYKRNLEIALPYVEKLIEILPGRTVVTADHGEAFGEIIHPLIPIRVYGHPWKIKIPVLIKVPWLIIEPEEKEPSEDLKKELIAVRREFAERRKEKAKLKQAIKNLKLKRRI